MKASENFGEIAKALVLARTKVENLYKSGKSYSNKYIPLDDVVDHLKAVLPALGLGYIQLPEGGTDGTIGLSTRIFHTSGEWIEASAEFALTNMKGINVSQGAGSAISYFRRYALCAAFGIVGDDDTDGNMPVKKENNQPTLDRDKLNTLAAIMKKQRKDGTDYFTAVQREAYKKKIQVLGLDETIKEAELALEQLEAAE